MFREETMQHTRDWEAFICNPCCVIPILCHLHINCNVVYKYVKFIQWYNESISNIVSIDNCYVWFIEFHSNTISCLVIEFFFMVAFAFFCFRFLIIYCIVFLHSRIQYIENDSEFLKSRHLVKTEKKIVELIKW